MDVVDPSPPIEEPADLEDGPSGVEETTRIHPETEVHLVGGDPRDASRLADVQTCADCHPEVARTWRASAHARASFDNPWYRQAVDSIREERGSEASRFCAGCHDPVLLVAGAMDEPIDPADPRAHAGVTCLVCHGTQEVRVDGVGSYTLSTASVPLPDPADEEEVAEHVAALTPDPLRTSALCGACHRGFLGPAMGNGHHLPGLDDVTAWSRSGFAGSVATRLDEPVEEATCQSCHMPFGPASEEDFATDDGRIHVHRVAGGHTALAAATGDDAQLAAVRRGMVGAARIDVAAARQGRRSSRPADGARVRAGQRLELDVVIRSLGVGHRFPGGTRDAQDTWVEVVVRDASGRLLGQSGVRHEREHDPNAHRLVAALADENAEIRELHRVQHFAAALFDRTLGPRDAEVVRYALEVPHGVELPLSIDARLRHRRHTFAMHTAACEAQRTERGAAFDAASRRLGRVPIDACVPQPITDIATARVWLGRGASERESSGGATDPTWRRLFDHALGLSSDVQEHLDAARPSLAAATRAAPDAHARAMILALTGRIEGRQGRVSPALSALDGARSLVGAHAAIHRLRGDAYAQVWRWDEAAAEYEEAASAAPLDDSRWAALARARGSAGEDAEALAAADEGLALSPRHEGLLRSRYLALEHLEREISADAREDYLAHRVPDALQALRLRCGEESAWCARERLPVHVHELELPR